jgi:uncharacterized protein
MTLDPSLDEADAFITACERLRGFAPRAGPEWADGYLTALAAGPRAIAIDEWLPKMFGDAFERCFADPADAAAAHAALAAHARVLAQRLDPERLLDQPELIHLAPLIWDWDDAERERVVAEGGVSAADAEYLVSGAAWTQGFLDALRDFSQDWDCDIEPDELAVFQELLASVDVLAWPDASERMREHLARAYPGATPTRDDLIDDACGAVQDLRVWWLDHGPRPATVHAAPKPGRNDPCHCGSGKKFKKCHGAAAS